MEICGTGSEHMALVEDSLRMAKIRQDDWKHVEKENERWSEPFIIEVQGDYRQIGQLKDLLDETPGLSYRLLNPIMVHPDGKIGEILSVFKHSGGQLQFVVRWPDILERIDCLRARYDSVHKRYHLLDDRKTEKIDELPEVGSDFGSRWNYVRA